MNRFTFLVLCACVANALLLAGCSKQTKWDYETVEGDDETLAIYGRFGWEMVSVSPASDGMSKFIFKKAADAEPADGETEATIKDNTRITEKEYHDAVATPTPEPKWKTDYREKMEALDRETRLKMTLIDGNEKIIESAERLTDAQIDVRTELDEAGKERAKLAASAYYRNLPRLSGTGLLDSGTFPNGSQF